LDEKNLLNKLPFILISLKDEPEMFDRSFDAGVDDYFRYPVNPERLYNRIAYFQQHTDELGISSVNKQSFHDDAAELEHDPNQVEINLAVASHSNSNSYQYHIHEYWPLKTTGAKDTAHTEYGHRHESFEHLNKGDAQVQVGGVAHPERTRIACTYRNDGSAENWQSGEDEPNT